MYKYRTNKLYTKEKYIIENNKEKGVNKMKQKVINIEQLKLTGNLYEIL